ncbi:hypothetical protein B0J17DRAFT_624836 [Rhizoctonia solani]|nr:hypothetical protein B0J17DRAFT_624836 [Rhizoctonia solani]
MSLVAQQLSIGRSTYTTQARVHSAQEITEGWNHKGRYVHWARETKSTKEQIDQRQDRQLNFIRSTTDFTGLDFFTRGQEPPPTHTPYLRLEGVQKALLCGSYSRGPTKEREPAARGMERNIVQTKKFLEKMEFVPLMSTTEIAHSDKHVPNESTSPGGMESSLHVDNDDLGNAFDTAEKKAIHLTPYQNLLELLFNLNT